MKNDNSYKKSEGRSVYERMIKVFIYLKPAEALERNIHHKFMRYGTAAREFLTSLKELIKMKITQSDLDLDKEIGEVPLVAEDFNRVILNICNNAFDFMWEKLFTVNAHLSASYKSKLTLRTKSGNGKVIIEIQDNGPGIPNEIKYTILQPFFTTKKDTAGTGLGLSITNDIIKAHDGYLDIQPDQNGSIFSITLKT